MAVYWQPGDSDPLSEFNAERVGERITPKCVPPAGISLTPTRPLSRPERIVNAVLVVTAVLIGAALFLVFAAAR